MQQTILLGLNELNFDFVRYYVKQGKLPVFQSLLEQYQLIETESEKEYHLLEPWIQWVTIHTGLTYGEHQIFRLGDITNNKHIPQLWEIIEKQGLSVGAVSPFNADNRLKNPSFFVPDPWTRTETSGSWLVKRLSAAVQQMVNDNAQSKLSLSSIISLLLGAVAFTSVKSWPAYFKLAIQLRKPGTSAIILDKLLGDVFISLWKKERPNFGSIFLNTGAHLQHHYLFNSQAYNGKFENPTWYCPKDYDPLERILVEYDNFIGRLLDLNVKLIIATGLHQKPHKHLTYYWRLKSHQSFLEKIGIQGLTEVLPRMSRDMLLNFDNTKSAAKAEAILASYKSQKDDLPIFTIDNRGTSLFVELTYPNEIDDSFAIISTIAPTIENFKREIAFVAIKNGEHDGIGYVLSNFSPSFDEKIIPLKNVFSFITETVLGRVAQKTA